MTRAIPFLILLTLTAPAWAGTITASNQQQADAAQPGDTVVVSMPDSRLRLKNGQAANRITYTGVAKGVDALGNAVGITIDVMNVNVTSGNAFSFPNGATDCSITRCDISWKGRTTGIYIGGKTTRVNVDDNWFHDSDKSSYRDIDVYDTEDFSYRRNKHYNTGYSMHGNGKHVRMKIIGNTYAYCWQVRGVEIQDEGHYQSDVGNDILVSDHIVYACREPHIDTFGASIPPQGATNVRVEDSYFGVYEIGKTDPFGGWGQPRDGGRKYQTGIGLEIGFKSGHVRRCTFVGPWVGAIVAMRMTPIKDNTSYSLDANGQSMNQWGTWASEGGNFENGMNKIIDEGNNRILKLSDAPPPRRTLAPDGTLSGTWADGTPVSGTPTTQPTPVPIPTDNKPTSVTATHGKDAQGRSYIDVRWEGGKAPFTVERYLSGGSKDMSVADVPASKSPVRDDRFTDSMRANTWKFYFVVNSVRSGDVQLQPTGGAPPDPVPGTATTTDHPMIFDTVIVINGVSFPVQFKATVQVTATGQRTVKAKP